MRGKQQAAGQGGRDAHLQPQAKETEERGDERVREEVDEMKAGRPHAVDEAVHTK